jgi:hypothetical protein
MFKITTGKGFHMTFDNGWVLSVQWGPHNYCDNRSWGAYDPTGEVTAGAKGCANAEIAAWGPDGNMYDFGSDTVKGWVSPNDLVPWILKFSNM